MNISINHDAPVRTEQSIFIAGSTSRVWALLSKIQDWPSWQSEIRQVQVHGALQAGTAFEWKLGGLGLRNTLHTVELDSAIGWDGVSLGMYAIHNWTLTAVAGGTQVTVEESVQGWPAKLLGKLLNGQVKKVNQNWLVQLKTAASG